MKKSLNVSIKDETISLSPISFKYFDDFHEYSTNPLFFKYFEYEVFKNKKQSKKYLKKLIINSKKKNFQSWCIVLKNEKKCIGTITVDIRPMRNSAELGYGLSRTYWGNGYFSRSLNLIENFLFKKIGIKRLFAITMAKNKTSINPLLKFGFKKEGVLKSFYKKKDKYEDAFLLSKINKN